MDDELVETEEDELLDEETLDEELLEALLD
jgi:hypothetical protein